MGRPLSVGLPYFPLDTKFDDEVELLEEQFGAEGFRVLIKAWQACFSTATGEVDLSVPGKVALLAKKCQITEEHWRQIIDHCALLTLFDRTALDSQILTSNGVKKRMARVLKEREKAQEKYQRKLGRNSGETGGEIQDISKNTPRKDKDKNKDKIKDKDKVKNKESDAIFPKPKRRRLVHHSNGSAPLGSVIENLNLQA